ncbi:MAG: bifunctional riboflavin kinase/FAD synthetase [Candidatus Omnitrophota bacterium]
MKTFYGYKDLKDKLKDPVAAIGIFDGIHIGHRRVISKVLNFPEAGRDKVIITFDPHPRAVLRPDKKPCRIMSLDHRLYIFEKMGIDAVIVIRFSDFIAMMPPDEFVKRIILGAGARKIFVGENFHFGRGKTGSVEDLKNIGARYGVDVTAVRPVRKNRKIVSSSWLRELIKRGDLERSAKILRRPVSVLGTVIRGDNRGAKLGTPTANIDPHHEVIPPPGVYAVKAVIQGQSELYDGVLNVGFKPTFYGRSLAKRKEPHIEAHILGCSRDFYGDVMEIFFIRKLRKEKKFSNEEKLKNQIKKDIIHAEKFLKCKMIVRKIRKYKYL